MGYLALLLGVLLSNGIALGVEPPSWLHQSSAGDSFQPVLAAGDKHFCLLAPDGARCWPSDGPASVVAAPEFVPLRVPTGLWAGGGNTCALDRDGLHCWGVNAEINRPPLVDKVVRLAISHTHACVDDGTKVRCWGNDADKVSPRELNYGKDLEGFYRQCCSFQNDPRALLHGRPLGLLVGDGLTCVLLPHPEVRAVPETEPRWTCLTAYPLPRVFGGDFRMFEDGFFHPEKLNALAGKVGCDIQFNDRHTGFHCADYSGKPKYIADSDLLSRDGGKLFEDRVVMNDRFVCAPSKERPKCMEIRCVPRRTAGVSCSAPQWSLELVGAETLALAGDTVCGIVGDWVRCQKTNAYTRPKNERRIENYFPLDRIGEGFKWIGETVYRDKRELLETGASLVAHADRNGKLLVMDALAPVIASVDSELFKEKIAARYAVSLRRHTEEKALATDDKSRGIALRLLVKVARLAPPSEELAKLQAAIGEALADPKTRRVLPHVFSPVAANERTKWLAQVGEKLLAFLERR